MNLKKATLLLAATALLTASSFAAKQPTAPAPVFSTGTETAIAGIYPNTLTVTVKPPTGTTYSSCTYSVAGAVTVAAGASCATPVTYTPTGANTTAFVITASVEVAGDTTATLFVSPKFVVAPQLTAPVLSPAQSTGSISVNFTAAPAAGTFPTIEYTNDGSDPAAPIAGAKTDKVAYKINKVASLDAYPAVDFNQPTIFRAFLSGYAPSLPVTGSYGVTTTAQTFIGAGSSAQFFEYALAMGGVLGDGSGACGEPAYGGHHFSAKNAAFAVDTRSGVTPADEGNLVIVWDNSADVTLANGYTAAQVALYPTPLAPKKVCVYLSLDSTLGVKAFLNSNLSTPSEYLNITTTGNAGSNANQISPFWVSSVAGVTPDEASIPADVLKIAQGAPFNAALTDIRPEDAKFATTRALAKITPTRSGLGYGPAPLGFAVTEATAPWQPSNAAGKQATFNVVDFALTGKDPINGLLQGKYVTVPVGAAPVVVIANTTVAADGAKFHFSDPSLQNISRFTLAHYLDGTFFGTQYLNPNTASTSGLASAPTSVFIREPLSGTYNTMEFDVVRSSEIGSSQEMGVTPIAGVGFSTTYTDGSVRARAIGTGDEVKAVAFAGADSLGYTFWGFGNIKSGNNSAPTQTKYLTVDGVDPLFAAYNGTGIVPTCTATNYSITTGCPGNITFTNVINGGYPIWSIYRAVVNPASLALVSGEPSLVSSVLSNIAISAAQTFDFVPVSEMQVFRSHYLQAGIAADNGNTGNVEAGGDVGGQVFTIKADKQFFATTAKELVSTTTATYKQ
jgi:hypothetical protein